MATFVNTGCDICGNQTHSGNTDGWAIINIKYRNDPKLRNGVPTKELDFCPDCMKIFQEWMDWQSGRGVAK